MGKAKQAFPLPWWEGTKGRGKKLMRSDLKVGPYELDKKRKHTYNR
jgi:hypothetical protein